MKNFFSRHGWLIFIIVLAVAFIGYIALINRDFVFKLGNGNWIIGLIQLPLVLLAVITTIRGCIVLSDKETEWSQDHPVLSIICGIAVIIGYGILVKLIFHS